eukprot:CAMPEP_0117581152 /NCGR_PEP_ID=MMETSP0784-20121206/65643_1 /TAXON_ID=39447 /ORGANISM="" /LENGTH=44 /DNA_ID= /DNA_START= /DNA_END= /DNA_ORIENTATION=
MPRLRGQQPHGQQRFEGPFALSAACGTWNADAPDRPDVPFADAH